jgi:hypothetical protein
MKISRESIERVLGKQPPVPVIHMKTTGTWSRMTDEERKAIIECKRNNPTYTYRELEKKFGRSNSAIWQVINNPAKT